MAQLKVYEFFSPGCPHCHEQQRARVLEQVIEQVPGVQGFRVDTDVTDELNERFRVQGLPTYVIAVARETLGRQTLQELARIEGAAPVGMLVEKVKQLQPLAAF